MYVVLLHIQFAGANPLDPALGSPKCHVALLLNVWEPDAIAVHLISQTASLKLFEEGHIAPLPPAPVRRFMTAEVLLKL